MNEASECGMGSAEHVRQLTRHVDDLHAKYTLSWKKNRDLSSHYDLLEKQLKQRIELLEKQLELSSIEQRQLHELTNVANRKEAKTLSERNHLGTLLMRAAKRIAGVGSRVDLDLASIELIWTEVYRLQTGVNDMTKIPALTNQKLIEALVVKNVQAVSWQEFELDLPPRFFEAFPVMEDAAAENYLGGSKLGHGGSFAWDHMPGEKPDSYLEELEKRTKQAKMNLKLLTEDIGERSGRSSTAPSEVDLGAREKDVLDVDYVRDWDDSDYDFELVEGPKENPYANMASREYLKNALILQRLIPTEDMLRTREPKTKVKQKLLEKTASTDVKNLMEPRGFVEPGPFRSSSAPNLLTDNDLLEWQSETEWLSRRSVRSMYATMERDANDGELVDVDNSKSLSRYLGSELDEIPPYGELPQAKSDAKYGRETVMPTLDIDSALELDRLCGAKFSIRRSTRNGLGVANAVRKHAQDMFPDSVAVQVQLLVFS